MKIGIMSFAHHHAEAYVHGLRQVPGGAICRWRPPHLTDTVST